MTDVTAFPPNGFGLYDMGGNVWQWCSDWYRPDTYAPRAQGGAVTHDPQGPADSFDPQEPGAAKRVLRAYLCTDQYCARYLVGSRGKSEVTSGATNLGFRFGLDSNDALNPFNPLLTIYAATARRTESGRVLGPAGEEALRI